MDLKHVANETLVSELKKLKAIECEALADIVRYLVELDSRKFYRDLGYPSLFDFCVRGLGYSEGSAMRRITAARCMRENEEVYELLKTGKISLCSLSQVAKVITPENKEEVLTLTRGLPKQEAQKLAARYMAPSKAKKETARTKMVLVERPVQEVITATVAVEGEVTSTVEVKPGVTATVAVVEEWTSLSVELDAEGTELLEEARRYAGKGKIADLLKAALKEYVAKRRPKSSVKEDVKPVETKSRDGEPQGRVLSNSRYIKREVRDLVRVRDGHRCSFVSADGTKCCETRALQYDHIVPYASGGSRDAENLRLVCPSHNQLYAERAYGTEFMANKRKQKPT